MRWMQTLRKLPTTAPRQNRKIRMRGVNDESLMAVGKRVHGSRLMVHGLPFTASRPELSVS